MFSTNRGALAMAAYRKEHKLTQAQAALLVGIDQMIWSRYERAESTPGLENANKIEVGTKGQIQQEWFLETVALRKPPVVAPAMRRRKRPAV